VIFCLSAWPGFTWLEEKLKGRKALAASGMTLFLAVCFLIPLLFLGSTLIGDVHRSMSDIIDELKKFPATPPEQVASIPVIGPMLAQIWQDYGADRQQIIKTVIENSGPIRQWLIELVDSIGHGIIDLSLGVIIAFFFFLHGVPAMQLLHNLTVNFVGPWGRHLLEVSKKTIIGIVYGVFGTAVAEGAFAGLGFWLVHIPGAPLLGLVTAIVSVAPAGFSFMWLPVTAWLLLKGYVGKGVFMFCWGALILSMADLFVRPYFISKGSNLPLLLVLIGIFGGIFAFGFIGLFIGPTLLAVAYVLLLELSRPDKPELTAAAG
jgi:predicted PurR-regulated permease PerM